METITRKSLLYKSGLGVLCINHVQGCSHGCRYPCYAFMIAQMHGRIPEYDEWCRPKLVSNAEELLKKELDKKRKRPNTIHLCLSTDPFMTGYDEVIGMSLKLIALINSYDIRCSILTKGILPAELTETTKYSNKNIYGISLISLNEDFRKKWEPGASPYNERINAARHLHNNGLYTLVHMEPYPTPNIIIQHLEEILESVKFADQIYFSGWNYNDQIKQFSNYSQFYREQLNIVRKYCKDNNIECNC
jgi:DNA repair photolyase